MEFLDVFTDLDLHHRPDDLLQDTAHGRYVLITKEGRPAVLAIPFDDRLLEYGLHRAMALHCFEAGILTLSQAAQIATSSLEDFVDLLGEVGIAAVDYPVEDLDQEVEATR
ncbi:prevent-host-death family protein [candidate division KSB3 bacterium]|uniref:Prevent-host-death family protein n=1 Tax=candidate division KSB3 bacterium TaxID=2044937 RepID=A0A9D5Q5G7_9BACT|nr:prevent-host-death family protein [candidate division KSB3 bacterium]MBD3323881.1 prevent-host-death family protein [candidate division KSB3 bacterium]